MTNERRFGALNPFLPAVPRPSLSGMIFPEMVDLIDQIFDCFFAIFSIIRFIACSLDRILSFARSKLLCSLFRWFNLMSARLFNRFKFILIKKVAVLRS